MVAVHARRMQSTTARRSGKRTGCGGRKSKETPITLFQYSPGTMPCHTDTLHTMKEEQQEREREREEGAGEGEIKELAEYKTPGSSLHSFLDSSSPLSHSLLQPSWAHAHTRTHIAACMPSLPYISLSPNEPDELCWRRMRCGTGFLTACSGRMKSLSLESIVNLCTLSHKSTVNDKTAQGAVDIHFQAKTNMHSLGGGNQKKPQRHHDFLSTWKQMLTMCIYSAVHQE